MSVAIVQTSESTGHGYTSVKLWMATHVFDVVTTFLRAESKATSLAWAADTLRSE